MTGFATRLCEHRLPRAGRIGQRQTGTPSGRPGRQTAQVSNQGLIDGAFGRGLPVKLPEPPPVVRAGRQPVRRLLVAAVEFGGVGQHCPDCLVQVVRPPIVEKATLPGGPEQRGGVDGQVIGEYERAGCSPLIAEAFFGPVVGCTAPFIVAGQDRTKKSIRPKSTVLGTPATAGSDCDLVLV